MIRRRAEIEDFVRVNGVGLWRIDNFLTGSNFLLQRYRGRLV
jgi:hypothetical protein